ncbi:amidohydrolase [Amaricoccus sp.]|uniref:amidohydrolase n=1 Tax=Amaricoccus sp. TaxID=1872485 RepID=UPI002CD55F37|nr:amidohydrolase [Amaricoccus sp.]HRW14290.1 amidohydrolase [Amaricoccus sp.]
MNVLRLSTAALLAAGAASHVWAQASPEPGGPAGLILKNGAIYTVDVARSWAQAVVVRDGRIVYVGDDAGSDAFAGSGTKVVDLEGKMVLPGFVDGHNHAYLMAESLFWLSLNPFATVEARQAAIRDRVTADPDLRQLRGVGWDDIEKDAAAAGVAPKDLLDAAAPDIPVVIIDNSHHNFWVNSAALALAGIDASTADPTGGTIERDPKTGEPNGVLREFAAQNLVINALPQPDFTAEEYQETILTWQELAARYGITSAFVPVHYPTETLLQALEALDNSGRLTVRYDLALWADENEGTEQIGHLKALRDAYQGESYKVDSVKIFSDGIGEEKLVWDQSDLEQTVTALDKEGFRVYVHAIGNPTFFPSGNVLDAFEKALDANGRRDSRHAITHLDWVKPEDVARFRDMGVLAVPQAAWFGKPWYDGTTGDAKKNQQRFQSLEDAGVVVVSSSDFPSTDTFERDMYPLTGLEVGMTRLDPDTATEAELAGIPQPEERASLEEMIASYTINGAYMIFDERDRGSIEPGKKADLVVLDRNLFELPATSVGEARVLQTYFEGEQVFGD